MNGVASVAGVYHRGGMETQKQYPTHSMEMRGHNGNIVTDWGRFANDAEAILAAKGRKLAKGLSLVRVIRNGEVIFQDCSL